MPVMSSLYALVVTAFVAAQTIVSGTTPGPGTVFMARITSGTAFVGAIICPDVCPSSGSMANVNAVVTSFGGQVLTEGTLELRGTYVVADPAATTGGFTLVAAHVNKGCSPCGATITAFTAKLQALSALYHPVAGVDGIPRLIFDNADYGVDPASPIRPHGVGWALDMLSGPRFVCINNGASSAIAIPGTVNINIAVDPNLATITGGTLIGSGNACNGDEIAHPNDPILLSGTGTWETGKKLRLTGMNAAGTQFTFTTRTPLTENYTGAAVVGAGAIFDFNNVSTTQCDAAAEINASVIILGGENARIAMNAPCLPINPHAPVPRTNTSFYRTVPLTMIRQQHQFSMIQNMTTESPCGCNDTALSLASGNLIGGQTSALGSYRGLMPGCFSWQEAIEQISCSDETTKADDGVGAMVVVQGPGFEWRPTVTMGEPGLAFWLTNASMLWLDTWHVESALQLVLAPKGSTTVNVTLNGMSQEMDGGCGRSGEPSCEPSAARYPMVQIEEQGSGAGTMSSWTWNFNNAFEGPHATPWLKINDPTHNVRFALDGAVIGSSQALDITGAAVAVTGALACDPGEAAIATSCDKPAGGLFNDFRMLRYDGTPYWNGATAENTKCPEADLTVFSADQLLAQIPDSGVLRSVWCATSGTIVTAPTYRLAECNSSGASCSDNTADLTCDADGDSTSTFGGAAGAAVDAGDVMQANSTNTANVTGGMTMFQFCWTPN